jgi:hypothetical protein
MSALEKSALAKLGAKRQFEQTHHPLNKFLARAA